jgi:hypothetical protein
VTPADLVVRWRELAATFAHFGQAEPAALLQTCANDLEAATTETALETLTLEQAATESGYSYSAIEKSVRAGRIPNAGAPGRPRIRRADLPHKVRRAGVRSIAAVVGRSAPLTPGPTNGAEGGADLTPAPIAPSTRATREAEAS